MANAAKIDIQGVQWELKDLNARNRITELEKKTTVKVTKKIDETNIKMNLIEINGEKFLQLHINGLPWSGIIGETVATFVQDFNLQNVIRCLIGMDFTDGLGRYIANLDIQSDGQIKIYPSVPNQVTGTYKAAKLYGDTFIRVAY